MDDNLLNNDFDDDVVIKTLKQFRSDLNILNKIIIFSTPSGTNCFYDIWIKSVKK